MVHGDKKRSSGPPLHWAPQTDLAGAEDNSERHGQSAGAFYYPEGIGIELEGPVKGQEGLCGSDIGGHLYSLGTLCLTLPKYLMVPFWQPMETRGTVLSPHSEPIGVALASTVFHCSLVSRWPFCFL